VGKVQKRTVKAISEIADLAIAEFDETDLSPQVNMALRTQIVKYVTDGVRTSVKGGGEEMTNKFKLSIANKVLSTVFNLSSIQKSLI
jgi:hypothetical protein